MVRAMPASDRDGIVETMSRYGRTCDTKDWSLLETCFTADAVIRYSPKFGDEIPSRDSLRDYLVHALTPLDATQHLFGNFEVESDGETGSFRCYVQAQHVRLDAPGGHVFTVGGRYLNRVTLGEDGLWRMTLLEFEPTWTNGNPEVLAHVMHADASAAPA
jgi:SnoaL-like domain